MDRRLPYLFVPLVVAALVGPPLAAASYQTKNYRNVRTVADGVLLRSGQLSNAGMLRMVHDHGVRTVISLRDDDKPGVPARDEAEATFCAKMDIKHVRLSPKVWWAYPNQAIPADENVATFLKVMDDPANYPVLVHCFAGIHRTGQMVAIYRMEYDRWTNTEAIREMRDCGYTNIENETDVLGYLENYRPRWARR